MVDNKKSGGPAGFVFNRSEDIKIKGYDYKGTGAAGEFNDSKGVVIEDATVEQRDAWDELLKHGLSKDQIQEIIKEAKQEPSTLERVVKRAVAGTAITADVLTIAGFFKLLL